MNKFNKRFFSLLLVFVMILSPVVSVGSSQLDLSFMVEENTDEVMIKLVGEKNEKASISIKNKDKYFFIDERYLDDKGILEFKVRLPKGDKYTLVANVAGLRQEKIIDIRDNTEPGIPEPLVDKVDLTINGYKGEILKGEYQVKKDDTVLSFTKRILDDKNISYEDRDGYIASIDGQGEMDKGENSGWVYRVNGKMPNEGAGSVKISKGDVLVWRYTYDYVDDKGENIVVKDRDELNKELDLISKELEKENIKDIERLADELGKNLGESLDKDRATMEKAINLSIKMNTRLGKDSKKKKENIVAISKDKDIILTKEFVGVLKDKKVDRVLLESKGVRLDIKVTSIDVKEDIEISINNRENLKIDIKPSKINKLEEKMKIIWPVEDIKNTFNLRVKRKDGRILAGLYDEKTGSMVFFTDGAGEFLVEEGNIAFDDMKNHWARLEIESLANKEIINGKSKDKFSPDRAISRGEFVALINRVMKYENNAGDNKFLDVSKDDWYYEDISRLSSLGIVRGKDNNRFEPNSKITREEIATIIARILENEGYSKEESKIEDRYVDRDNISSWAVEGVDYLSLYDLLRGDSKNRLNPKANASRAEAGIIQFRLYELILFN